MNWDSIVNTLSTAKDFGKGAVTGVWEGGKSMVEGAGQLANAGYKTATDSAYRDEVFNNATDLAKNSANFAAKAWKDPIGTAKTSWDGAQNAVNALGDRYVAARDEAKGNGTLPEFYGNVIGRGGFEVGTVLIPVTKLSKLGKAGEVIADTEKLAKVGKTTESAVNVASKLPEVGLGPKIACPKFKVTSNGAIIKPNPNKTTTVLGRFDTDMSRIINDELKMPKGNNFGAKQGGFNVLNVPDEMYKNPTQFWDEINKPFLDKAIQRGDDILMASDPTTASNLFKANGELTGFGLEVEHLIKNGYQYDPITKSMIK